MTLVLLLWLLAILLGLGAVATAFSRSSIATPVVYGVCLAASAAALALALICLCGGASLPEQRVLPLGLPWLGAHVRLDALSAFFLAVVNLGGAMASLYGIGYGRHERAAQRVLPAFPPFLAGMNLVVIADDAFTFVFAWEFMSLVSWALVMSHHREAGSARAGFVYLMMASIGTLSLLLAFGLLAGADGGYSFSDMRVTDRSATAAGIVFVLVIIGTGSKAGLVPLHAWLPLAHPAAPSHVSALMSGVMTKVAVYGFIRLVFDLSGQPPPWWSMTILALAGTTAVLGILYALMQNDLKRLLAYSTVENIGIIFVGLGLALAFQANGIIWAAALALTAALFHVLNHTLFKSLLFFGAGAILTATGKRDMDSLGGLIHRMPLTAFTFLVAAVAISALPPLNGFVSEWLTFQAVLVSPTLPQWGLKFLVPAVGALLALSAALTAACFVKAFGVPFLGRPRSRSAEQAHEVDRFSLTVMIALSALCLLAGILPGAVIDTLAPVSQQLIGWRMPVQRELPWLSIVPIAEGRSSYNGLNVFIFIAFSALLAAFVIHRAASRAIRRAPPWDCGFPDARPATQYTAGSFAQPLRRVFGTVVFRASEKVTMPPPGDNAPARFEIDIHDMIWDKLYRPVATGVLYASDRLNPLQFLTIRRYLGLAFATLVLLLVVLVLSQ
ncbi:MAG: hydrogenase 4 subunit B [Hyphomicrobium sp.]